MATIGISNEKFFKIIDEIEIKNKCEKCNENEIKEGAIFNYCSGCFKIYVEELEKERKVNNTK